MNIFSRNLFKSFNLFFIYIILISSLGQVLADLYLPSLPYIQKDLETTANNIQLSVAIFMFGFSFPQLVYGSLSDSFGRKYTFLTSLVIANIGSLMAMSTNSITWLLIGRLLQGIGASGCSVTARAMIRDTVPENNLAKMISYLTIISVFIIASAPLVGGYIQQIFGWRTTFMILSIYVSILLFIQFFFIKETNIHLSPKNISPSIIIKNYYQILTNKIFVLSCLCNMLAYGGLIAWLTSGPFIVQNIYGYNAIEFGYICTTIALHFAIGGILNSKIVTMQNAPIIIHIGFIFALIAGILLLVCLWIINNFLLIILAVGIFFFSAGIIIPNSAALCMHPFKKIAGLAVSIMGCLQIAGGALTSFIISYIPEHDHFPLTMIFIIISIIGLVISVKLISNNKN